VNTAKYQAALAALRMPCFSVALPAVDDPIAAMVNEFSRRR
jgi:hypothetical protein